MLQSYTKRLQVYSHSPHWCIWSTAAAIPPSGRCDLLSMQSFLFWKKRVLDLHSVLWKVKLRHTSVMAVVQSALAQERESITCIIYTLNKEQKRWLAVLATCAFPFPSSQQHVMFKIGLKQIVKHLRENKLKVLKNLSAVYINILIPCWVFKQLTVTNAIALRTVQWDYFFSPIQQSGWKKSEIPGVAHEHWLTAVQVTRKVNPAASNPQRKYGQVHYSGLRDPRSEQISKANTLHFCLSSSFICCSDVT